MVVWWAACGWVQCARSSAPVRVWSVGQKKLICETATDAKGACTIPKLPAGPLNVMIPRGRVRFYPADLAKELSAGPAAIGKLLTTEVILIGGTATAVGVVAGHGLADDGDDTVVSP